MINVVLLEPEIPNNTGNIVRTCAATGAVLHVIEPCGFLWEDRYLKRSGLDYWDISDVRRYSDLNDFLYKNFNYLKRTATCFSAGKRADFPNGFCKPIMKTPSAFL